MISYEEFVDMVDELMAEIPDKFYRDLDGGVNVKEEIRIHPESLDDDLIILGEYYSSRYLGKMISIYYGSFKRLYSHLDRETLKKRVRKTLRHEFRHHLETLGGEKDLVIEDLRQLADYKRCHRMREKPVDFPENRDRMEEN